jgi:hypothetical protein
LLKIIGAWLQGLLSLTIGLHSRPYVASPHHDSTPSQNRSCVHLHILHGLWWCWDGRDVKEFKVLAKSIQNALAACQCILRHNIFQCLSITQSGQSQSSPYQWPDLIGKSS